MWAGLSTMNSSAKKKSGTLYHHEGVDFDQWVMLIAQDQGQPPTTALYRESYMGNMGSNHSFRDTQGPRNPRKITQDGGSGMGSNDSSGKVPKSAASSMPLTRVPVHLTPESSDIHVGVPTVAAPNIRSTVIHVKNSLSNSTLFDLAFTPIVYS